MIDNPWVWFKGTISKRTFSEKGKKWKIIMWCHQCKKIRDESNVDGRDLEDIFFRIQKFKLFRSKCPICKSRTIPRILFKNK